MSRRTRNTLLRCVLWVVLILVLWYNVAHIRVLSGISMEPALGDGAIVLVYELGTHYKAPDRGDIVCVKSNEDADHVYCKRVLALPGETIEFRNGVVHIDGEKLDEPWRPRVHPAWNMAPLKLDDRHVYIVGDNRGMTHMSDHYQGPADLDNVVGEVVAVLKRGAAASAKDSEE